MKIKYIRRASQIIFFILIIYGGLLIAQTFQIKKTPIARGTEDEINLIDVSPPIRTCRYIEPKPALFDSCSIRYMLDRPLYMGPWFTNSWFSISIYILIIISLCFILGRFMCGWICPIGFSADILNYSRQKLRINRINISDKLKKFLKFWKYSFLIFLIFLSIAILLPFLYGVFMNKDYFAVACQVCPVKMIVPLFNLKLPIIPPFLTIATSVFTIFSFIFLGIYILGVIITRPWCRICPNGAFISLFNKGSLISKNKDTRRCTKCRTCKRVCPFTNDHVYDERKKKFINDENCIMCFSCIDNCPEDNCLSASLFGIKIFKSKFKK